MNYGKISSFQTGVVVPLFSLRSKDSIGVGEFADLVLLGRWAKKCNLDLIQLLPINDTGEESSPYSARSAFALNPVYIRLQDIEGAKEILGNAPNTENKRFAKSKRIPYVEVVRYKRAALHSIFTKKEQEISQNEQLKSWIKENPWVESYSEFCARKVKNDEASWRHWKKQGKPSDSEILFQKWMQWVAETQFLKAVSELNEMDVRLKGDVPILINEDSADVWSNPQFFSLENAAGAPPDMFCYSGQNWAFPTYRWDNIEADNFGWWRARLKQAAKFYHAYRIDHVLGFFRIWVIPQTESTGILGHFSPSIPIELHEVTAKGIPEQTVRYLTLPNYNEEQLHAWFGSDTKSVVSKYFETLKNEPSRLVIKEKYRSERAILDINEEQPIKDGLLSVYWNRIFVPDSESNKLWAYWYWYNAPVLLTLPEHERAKIHEIVRANENKQEKLWRDNGHKLLSVLSKETDMLVCAEDLGAVPNCVPDVLNNLGILSLRVERWARSWNVDKQPYIQLNAYPRLSVCTSSNHDSSTLLGLWNEPDFNKDLYWRHLGQSGRAPEKLSAEHIRLIINNLFHANSLVAILPLQDFLAVSSKYISKNPEEDRVNTPGTVGPENWSWRIPCDLDDLLNETDLNSEISKLVKTRKGRELK